MIINEQGVCRCGRAKTESAAMCRECTDMLRSLRAGGDTDHKHDRCECGELKLKKSRQCWTCYSREQHMMTAETVVCPECGGEKDRRASRCSPCDAARKSALFSEAQAKRNDTCSCGRTKRKTSIVCWVCKKAAKDDRLRCNLKEIGADIDWADEIKASCALHSARRYGRA